MGLSALTVAYISAAVSVGSAIYASSLTPDDENGTTVTKQGTQAARNKVYGKAIVGCTNVYSDVENLDRSHRTDVFAVGGVGTLRFHNVWIDDKKMFEDDIDLLTAPLNRHSGIYNGKDSMRKPYRYGNSFIAHFRSGQENQVAASTPVETTAGEWTNYHRGSNVPHVTIHADYVSKPEYAM